ncbi:right-handed parallel beta-helix repeat-containing protein, partial [Methanococcoides sp.]|uniref:right-handed parallel beta-helix repeat-containing protein n=1 Tax=Methanococcoides sp. TaxID=1966350 RepID=UPI00272E9BE4
MTIGTAAAVTYNVTSIAGPQNYTTIQQAVDNATAGDTILVYPGTYNENVNVTKQLNITSTDGAASTYVTAATSGNHVFNVTADWVTISGFNITGATASDKAGIYLNSSNNSMLISNTASNNSIGILLTSSSYNNLTSNTATDNTQSGIQLAGSPFIGGPSSYNILTDNTATNNSIGIQLGFASYNNLTSNTASNNTGDGISLSGIPFGPFGGPSSYNDLTNNTASNNTGDGINLLVSSNNKLTDNTASNNSIGINLFVSRYNNLTSNTATDNTGDGIRLSGNPIGHIRGPTSYNILTDNTAKDNTG